MDILYRGYGESSASIFSSETGFRARDTTTDGENARVLSTHLNWSQRKASPLISTTTSRAKAETIAEAARGWYDKRRSGRKERIFIATLDTRLSSPGCPRRFHMLTLADRLGVPLEPWTSNYHEYLFEHFIPLEWVIEVQELNASSMEWVTVYQMAAEVCETLLSEPFLCNCEKDCAWMSIAYA